MNRELGFQDYYCESSEIEYHKSELMLGGH